MEDDVRHELARRPATLKAAKEAMRRMRSATGSGALAAAAEHGVGDSTGEDVTRAAVRRRPQDPIAAAAVVGSSCRRTRSSDAAAPYVRQDELVDPRRTIERATSTRW